MTLSMRASSNSEVRREGQAFTPPLPPPGSEIPRVGLGEGNLGVGLEVGAGTLGVGLEVGAGTLGVGVGELEVAGKSVVVAVSAGVDDNMIKEVPGEGEQTSVTYSHSILAIRITCRGTGNTA